ncbi:MAG: hypothetical protein RLZ03_1374, partial [Pseudomonadota bacterium]
TGLQALLLQTCCHLVHQPVQLGVTEDAVLTLQGWM